MIRDLPGPTQLLLRHLPGGPGVLVVDAPDVASATALRDACPDVTFLFRDYAAHRACAGAVPGEFASWTAGAVPPTVAIFLPKGKELLRATLAAIPAGDVWLVGENDGGIRSALGILQERCPDAAKVDVGRHSALLRGTAPPRAVTTPGLAVAAPPERTWALAWRGVTLEIVDRPGVFSAGELDEGTQRLLDALPDMAGRVLDVGCGAGVLGAAIATRYPACEVEMVDASAMAVEATLATLRRNGVANARCRPSDVWSDVEGTFDRIVSNPPFHAGIATDARVATELVAGAPARLRPGGEVWIVANRFLDYRRLLAERFVEVTIPWEDGRFRVLRARSPLPGATLAGAPHPGATRSEAPRSPRRPRGR